MLMVFVAGINQTDQFGGCVAVSALIQYFTLVSMMWMGAEAMLMFQKLVIVFVQITTKYVIIVSLICWCKLFSSFCIARKVYGSPYIACSSIHVIVYAFSSPQWLL